MNANISAASHRDRQWRCAPILRSTACQALRRFSRRSPALAFQVNRGEVVCLIGPSGSGKSTLLRCTNGARDDRRRRVVFDGRERP